MPFRDFLVVVAGHSDQTLFLVVSSLITGGCIRVPEPCRSMQPQNRSNKSGANRDATTMEVGPSAAPMIPMEAASRMSYPKGGQQHCHENTELCRAPNNNNDGLRNRGLKSIMLQLQ